MMDFHENYKITKLLLDLISITTIQLTVDGLSLEIGRSALLLVVEEP